MDLKDLTMKRYGLLLITILMMAPASMDAQLGRTVYARGAVTTTDRQAGSFHSIMVSSGIDVLLTVGDKESIRVEADENLHEYILTDLQNGVLHVYSRVNIRNAKSRKVFLTMSEVKSVTTSSAGDVTGLTPVVSDFLELSTSSAGNINLEVKALDIKATTSSSGDITLRGSAGKITASLSSAGDLKALDLTVKEADITASSAGDARITVTERLRARASSAGDILYRGDPKYVDAQSSSAGSVRAF
ncbi:MAG: DUF2807 domain-containing protein [Bacteroidetes bacterium]|nr:DUF2807 domain-containing protein [Bacteroidota bacterium]